MKIIELLNKIANGEESDLQTEFEFDSKIWNFYKLNHSEYCLDGWLLNQNITITKHDEVEILEEDKIEKIDIKSYVLTPYNKFAILDLQNKVNELIDKLNKEE